METTKQINEIITRYELENYNKFFVQEVPKDILEFSKALYFEADEETLKNIYREYKTKENLLNFVKNKRKQNTVIDVLDNIEDSNKWKNLETELFNYNPFEPLNNQKRQDEIDITTLPDNVKLLFNEELRIKFVNCGKHISVSNKPIYKECPDCGKEAQVYYLCRNFVDGEYYIKILCRHCHKSFKIDIEKFMDDLPIDREREFSDNFIHDLTDYSKNYRLRLPVENV